MRILEEPRHVALVDMREFWDGDTFKPVSQWTKEMGAAVSDTGGAWMLRTHRDEEDRSERKETERQAQCAGMNGGFVVGMARLEAVERG